MYVSMLLSVRPTLSFPSCVYKPVLYVYVSTAALQIGSSVPSSWIPVCVCMCVCVCVRVRVACVCVCSEILLSHKKEWNNAICRNMDGPGDYHAK